jgi:two-component system LytT family response regulator
VSTAKGTAPLRALVVDDEPLARELLRRMLDEHPALEVIGECASGTQAVEAVRAERPDLLFLDVQMPGLDGFAVLRELAPDLPEVIFVTAYDQYALRAFDVHALDYLLKPFDEERLARAIDRARAHLRRPDAESDRGRILELLDELRGARRWRERLVIRAGERAYLQPVAEIDWLEADGKYVKVHVGPRAHTIRETMTQLADVLDPRRFLRISRSAIVNVDRIREIQPWFRGDYVVILQNGAEVTSTRGYRDTLKALLAGES